MAAVSISGNVTAVNIASVDTKIASEAIDAGEVVYLTTSGQLALADADAEASAVAIGVALADADSGAPCPYVKNGGVLSVSGAPFTLAVPYYVSPTAGGISPVGDIMSGDYVTLLGIATSTSLLPINIVSSGVALG